MWEHRLQLSPSHDEHFSTYILPILTLSSCISPLINYRNALTHVINHFEIVHVRDKVWQRSHTPKCMCSHSTKTLTCTTETRTNYHFFTTQTHYYSTVTYITEKLFYSQILLKYSLAGALWPAGIWGKCVDQTMWRPPWTPINLRSVMSLLCWWAHVWHESVWEEVTLICSTISRPCQLNIFLPLWSLLFHLPLHGVHTLKIDNKAL